MDGHVQFINQCPAIFTQSMERFIGMACAVSLTTTGRFIILFNMRYMFGFHRVLLIVVITAFGSFFAVGSARGDDLFERRIRPLLIERCSACHGAEDPEKGLTLTSIAGIAKGNAAAPLIVPSNPSSSRLIQAVRYKSKLKMPPDRKLHAEEIRLLEQWVREGAKLPDRTIPIRSQHGDVEFPEEDRAWWAFQPIGDPVRPEVNHVEQVRTAVDRFVLKRLETHSLSLSPEADRRTLIRRVTLDLIGLPPTSVEVELFVADDRPDAYERLVDRLLSSPHFGERWGRHWLDIARYADTNGGGFDYVYPNAWRYRDYVVGAMNEDKPYDEFLTEQLAGDLLPPTDDPKLHVDRLAATGFLTLTPKGLGMQDKELMVMDVVDDQIDVLGRSLMGITLACARCHDHKFDPIPTKDYYSLAGIFRSTTSLIDTNKNPSYWPERALELPSVTAARKVYLSRKAANEKAVAAEKKKANAAVIAAAQKRQADYIAAAARIRVSIEYQNAIAHWTFDETDGDTVTATVGPDGPLSNVDKGAGPKPTRVKGRLGRAMRFSGRKDIVAVQPDGLEFGTATDFTVSFWLRASEGYSPNTADTVLAVNYPMAMWFIAMRPGSYNGIYLRHYDGQRAVDIKPNKNCLPLLSDTAWHHIVFTSDRDGSGTVYIDGEKSGDIPISSVSRAAQFQKAKRFSIGAATNQFLGELDDVAIWNRLLSLAEIQAIFNQSQNVAQIEAERARNRDDPKSAKFTYEDAARAGLVPSILRRFVDLSNNVDDNALRKLIDDKKTTPYVAGDDVESFYSDEAKQRLATRRAEAGAIAGTRVPDATMAMVAFDAQRPTDLRIHIAGDRKNPGDLARRGFPRIITSPATRKPAENQSGRLELAHWLTDPNHPLTARVFVNRIWQWHFGGGLVSTPDNFGRLGERPSHPELLDWLASRLIHNDWSIKQLHRQILLSATYRQASTRNPQSVDSANQLLPKMNRRRLEAEALRDSMLAVSGQLDRRIGGTGNNWKAKQFSVDDANNETANYQSNRRSIYLPVVRGAAVHEMLRLFDFGDPNSVTARRDVTTVAPQALFLINNPFVIEQSKRFAARLLRRSELDSSQRIRLAYQLALSRQPSDSELTRAEEFVHDADQAAWQLFCQSLFCLNEFAYTD